MLIDSHCHLEKAYSNGQLDGLLERAREAGITQMITVGTDRSDWKVYRKLAAEYPEQIRYTVGLHPCDVEEDWVQQIEGLATYFKQEANRPVALGEIGLDNYWLPKDEAEAQAVAIQQASAFSAQLQIAKALDCPVIIHSRESFHECVQLIDESGIDWEKVVFHCFSEGPDEVSELNARGGRASFTGIVTYNKNVERVQEAVCRQGLERIMVETDAPYLTPTPHRGKPNEPAYVRHTAEKCAELLGVSLEELAEKATANTREFYGL